MINNTANMNCFLLDDSQLVKLAKSGNFDALSELWLRHIDFVKKVTLNQYYKIRPDFSEDCSNSEKLWNFRMGSSYINLAKAVAAYDTNLKVPFLAYFAMKNKYAFLDEKAFNTEMSARYDYCENYDRYESREQVEASDVMDVVHAIEKSLRFNKGLLAFFQKYVAVISDRGYVSQTEMAKIMGVSRQMVNTNFRKIRAIAKEYGLEKEVAEILSAREKVGYEIPTEYVNDYESDEVA